MRIPAMLRCHFAFCNLCAVLGLAFVLGLLLLTPLPAFAQSPSAGDGFCGGLVL